MQTRSILQLVSGFKPSVDGMGDFSRRLGDALWKQHSIQSHFLVYRKPKTSFDTAEIAPNTLSYSPEQSPAAYLEQIYTLLDQHSFECVLLHYGGYAYASNGRPAPFASAMQELAKKIRLLTFFHETYATGLPWRRSFWTRREQRNAVRSLLESTNAAFTSNWKYRGLLEPLNTRHLELTEIPIFSNIGEPAHLRPLNQRTRRLVVFGQLVTRVRLYSQRRKALEEICRKLHIESIADVGSGKSPHIPSEIAGAPVTSAGFMEEQQLSDLMADSIAGIVGYWPDVWQKSGVIAAYQAHRLVPIMVEMEKRSFPKPMFLPFVSPEHIAQLSGNDETASDARIQAIADAALANYMQTQSVTRCADVIAGAVSGASSQG